MAICFHFLQVLAQSETYNIICFDKAIKKELSEQISTHCVLKQAEVQKIHVYHVFLALSAGSHLTVK